MTRLIKGANLQLFNATRTFNIDQIDTATLIDRLGEKAVQFRTDFATKKEIVRVTEPEFIFFTVAEFKKVTGLPEGFGLDLNQILIVGFAIVLFIALYWFLTKTKPGKAIYR